MNVRVGANSIQINTNYNTNQYNSIQTTTTTTTTTTTHNHNNTQQHTTTTTTPPHTTTTQHNTTQHTTTTTTTTHYHNTTTTTQHTTTTTTHNLIMSTYQPLSWKVFLIVFMTIAGTCNVVVKKFQNSSISVGIDHRSELFAKPFFQTFLMFVGELVCLLVFKVQSCYQAEPKSQRLVQVNE